MVVTTARSGTWSPRRFVLSAVESSRVESSLGDKNDNNTDFDLTRGHIIRHGREIIVLRRSFNQVVSAKFTAAKRR